MAPEESSVGKRIVEALKMQNGGEGVVESVVQDSSDMLNDSFGDGFGNDTGFEDMVQNDAPADIQPSVSGTDFAANTQNFSSVNNISIDTAFAQSINQNLGYSVNEVSDDFEYPANVAVLRQLVAKLPQGVSKQMGATIIKQTLEAVGIPMSGVLDEARQVQNALNEKARNCQSSIIDYRRQIGVLEAKSKQYQKQFALLNEIINLFLHVN